MDIQWYPGHMTKSIRIMQEDIRLVDLVIELVDARIPLSSRNPDIDRLAGTKSRLLILNKSDLSDENCCRLWISYFKGLSINAILLDSRKTGNKKRLLSAMQSACSERIQRDRERGMKERPIRAMVVGIPNVGKSTFINSFSGKAMAKTGNKPGVTKGKQWIHLEGVDLLDTPGLLWPKFDDPEIGLKLALIGAINDEILSEETLALQLIRKIMVLYPEALEKRYSISEAEVPETLLAGIGKKRGCLVKGGEIDLSRTSDILLDDFRQGRLGRISLEVPADFTLGARKGYMNEAAAQPDSADSSTEQKSSDN